MKLFALSLFSVVALGDVQVHTVIVGGDAGLVYTPSNITASVGDIVMFQFMKNNHTATQSTFAKPCVKMAGGFDSQFMPNINNTQVPPPTANFTVTSTDPAWFYCRQKTGTHCGKGMVFSINETPEKSFDMFKSMAIQQNGTTSTTAAASAGTSTAVTLVANPPSTTSGSSVVSGSGQSENGQSCSCQCLCAVALFPVNAGIGSYGGFGGSLPMPS